jgi:hypothetical protein
MEGSSARPAATNTALSAEPLAQALALLPADPTAIKELSPMAQDVAELFGLQIAATLVSLKWYMRLRALDAILATFRNFDNMASARGRLLRSASSGGEETDDDGSRGHREFPGTRAAAAISAPPSAVAAATLTEPDASFEAALASSAASPVPSTSCGGKIVTGSDHESGDGSGERSTSTLLKLSRMSAATFGTLCAVLEQAIDDPVERIFVTGLDLLNHLPLSFVTTPENKERLISVFEHVIFRCHDSKKRVR